jgi:ATP-binding cassette subfamily B protein
VSRASRLREARRKITTSLLWELLGTQKLMFWALAGSAVVIGPFTFLIAQQLVQMVDKGIVDQAVPLGGYVQSIAVLTVFAMVGTFLIAQVGAAISYRVEYDLRLRLYRAIHSSALDRLDRSATGQLVTRSLTDLIMIEQSMRVIPLVIGLVPVILGLAVFLLIQNLLIGLVAVTSLPINIWLVGRFRRRLRALTFAELNERSEIASAIDEPVKGIRVVRAFGREDHERTRVGTVALRTYRFAMTRWRLLAKFDVPMKAAPLIATTVVLGIGAFLVANDDLTLGTFVLAFSLVHALSQLGNYVIEIASAWQYVNSAQHRVSEVLEMGAHERTDGVSLPPPGRGVEVAGASVHLGGRDVLTDVDLAVRPGELLVATGSPGSGKSTLAALLAGRLPADRGQVSLDGVDVTTVDPDELRRAVRVVSEDAFMFSFSIRENLAMACDGRADEAAMRAALHAAGADDFVDTLPQGIDTPLGDRGLTVSGGQRQRLAVARALVEPPRLLVLDDALSAVNPSMEVEILRRIRAHSPGTAIVFLSRRRSAESVGDRVVELPPPDLSAMLDRPTGMPSMAGSELALAQDVLEVLRDMKLTEEDPDVGDEFAAVDRPARVRELVRCFRFPLAVTLLALLLQTLGNFAPEVAIGSVADLVEDGETGGIVGVGLLLVAAGVVGITGSYFLRVFGQRLNQGVMYGVRRRVFQRLSKLGIDHYDRELPGDVAARIVFDLDQITVWLQASAFVAIQNVAKVLVSLTLVSILAPAVLPVVLGAAAVVLALVAIQTPFNTRAFDRARDELGRVVSTFEEDMSGRSDIRAFGALDRQEERFRELARSLKVARRRAALVQNGFGSVVGDLHHIIAALVLYRAGGLVLAGTVSVGSALTVRLLTSQGTAPLATLGREFGEVLKIRVSWQRLAQPFDVPILPVAKPDAVPVDAADGDVEFQSVAFAYPHTGRQILHDVSMRLPAGSVTALVGFTGAGKSSIAKLLIRTYDPDAGSVRIGGLDLRDIDYDSYRPHVGVVPQDAFLFRGTIRSNILYGKLDASDEDMEAAARAVGAHEVLEALPGGYDHVVEEEARNLTAAQRQLVALARAWIAEPDLLVLDEATSCLDAALEQRVLDAVRRLDCTTLTVTHRDNVAASCDRVIVLDDGRVVDEGSPEELKGAGGAFDRLWVVVPPTPPPDDEADLAVAAAP